MPKEIERKFLVNSLEYKALAEGILYRQGYILATDGKSVRIRTAGEKAYITLKTRINELTRLEYEYEISVNEAIEMLSTMCEKPIIEKLRYTIDYKGDIWEVDEFKGDNDGLIVAEIELQDENQKFAQPQWIGNEVTADSRYLNTNLVRNPYKLWKSTI